ncbi:MAG: glycosyltransferase family 2 protein [Candidatus Methylumidiphilus sp.]
MISVIVVNYFSHALTARAVRSALADDPSAQIIVVDNSDDATEAEALAKGLPEGVECIIAPVNLGFGRGCNLAMEHAKGEWVFLLNPDAYVLPGCLGRLGDTLRRHPRVGAVAPVTQWDDAGRFILPFGQMPTPAWEWLLSLGTRVPPLGRLLSKRFRAWTLNCLQASKPVSHRMLSGGHILLRRQAVDAIGGLFDPSFFMYYEDTDLCRRLHSAGFGLLLDPCARVVHEWRNDPSKNRFIADSRRRYLDKHFPYTWLKDGRREQMERCWPARSVGPTLDLGVCMSPPTFDLPTGQSGQWLLELSPNPLLIPSAYSVSSNPPCRVPPHIWGLLGAGRYWVRVTAPGGRESLFTWDLPAFAMMNG